MQPYDWFIPEVEEFVIQRAVLTLKLNKAIRYYRELIVPGIGGVRFGRQFSWTLAALRIAPEIKKYSAVKIANSIEALAGKLEYRKTGDVNLRGIRAFQRYEDEMSFDKLSQSKYYVRIPYRMATVRGLHGLGFTNQARFNSMQLTQIGNDLADKFLYQDKGGKGGKSIENALIDWILNEKDINIPEGLIRQGITDDEKSIIRKRMLSDAVDNMSNPHRRADLINVYKPSFMKKDFNMEEIKRNLPSAQQKEFGIAQAFDAMLSNARELIQECAKKVEDSGGSGTTADKIYKKVSKTTNIVVESGKKFLKIGEGSKILHADSVNFARDICNLDKDEKQILLYVIERDGAILKKEQGTVIKKGPLFFRREEIKNTDSENDNAEFINSDMSSTREKIEQLYQLWSDCQ